MPPFRMESSSSFKSTSSASLLSSAPASTPSAPFAPARPHDYFSVVPFCPSHTHSLTHQLKHRFEEVNWLHVSFKALALSYLAFFAWLAWGMSPWAGNISTPQRPDKFPILNQDISKYTASPSDASSADGQQLFQPFRRLFGLRNSSC